MKTQEQIRAQREADNQRAFDEGTQWPLCAVCRKTLANPKFGGPPVEYQEITEAHEECAKAE